MFKQRKYTILILLKRAPFDVLCVYLLSSFTLLTHIAFFF